MAKHKNKKAVQKRRVNRRKHSMGAIPATIITPIVQIAGAIGGYYLVNKFLSNQNDTVKGGVLMGVGILASNFVKNPLVQAAGAGMIIGGGLKVAKSVKPALLGGTDDVLVIAGDISEFGGVDQIGDLSAVNGDLSEINGDISEINGVDQIGADDFMSI